MLHRKGGGLMHRTFAVYTLGCKVSQYESEAILEEAVRRGFTPVTEGADIAVINTCTVTAEGDRKCRQLIRRLVRQSPETKIMVCGCYSQVSPESVSAIDGVAYVCGTQNKLRTVERALELLDGKAIPKIEVAPLAGADFESMRILHAPRTRAYIKIEDGCDNRCAYCKIPDARGHVRSKKIADVVAEARALTDAGVREVVLTGIETASFGADTGESLCDLLDAVNGIDGIERIRLGSLEPTLMRPAFLDRIAKVGKLTPHFHLSMQSGSSRTLAAMRRKYNAETALRNIENTRAALPGVQFTTDFIVGFPGETDEDFAETMEFARRVGFLATHVFKYSKRAGTPAAKMPDQIPEEVKHARSQALIALSAESTAHCLAEILAAHPTETVLFEQKIGGLWSGHTAAFAEVRAASDADLHGELRKVRLDKIEDGYIRADLNL
ncbi:MAG: tRNA (N(6)-L-threonylcarbamoyladenosine(37)-C(2))-methylthiotransferase MtaB [Oscillospiraceae bacterium]|nr:MAG: tRNA (N(6)-L-threonylcarbamoyladenosine(37)-C(2))-methylthiotransferase MtaB [Oscillospiraceae bacterium]